MNMCFVRPYRLLRVEFCTTDIEYSKHKEVTCVVKLNLTARSIPRTLVGLLLLANSPRISLSLGCSIHNTYLGTLGPAKEGKNIMIHNGALFTFLEPSKLTGPKMKYDD